MDLESVMAGSCKETFYIFAQNQIDNEDRNESEVLYLIFSRCMKVLFDPWLRCAFTWILNLSWQEAARKPFKFLLRIR